MADIVDLDEMNDALNLNGDVSHDSELESYIQAVTAHVEERWGGALPSSERTEIGLVVDLGDGTARLSTSRPVLAVASVTDGTDTYDADFTITPDGYVEHEQLGRGRWTIVYDAGYEDMPADLKLAALEDIRGVFQPGQIGPPAQFGAFGIESTDVGTTYRPVRMWPRVDAWLDTNIPPSIR